MLKSCLNSFLIGLAKHNGSVEKSHDALVVRGIFLPLTMNAPCTFSIKNNGISQYFDVSYLNFTRNGDTSMLKQNQKTPFSQVIKKYKPTSNFLEEVNRIKFKHDLHRQIMSKGKKCDKCKDCKSCTTETTCNHCKRCTECKKPKYFKELGTLSTSQVKSCKKACELLINTVFLSKDKTVHYKTGQYVVFLTLTLPSTQIHSDKQIKRLQTRYIENLQKTYGVNYYVWKAEAQKNGNIHFHLLVDKWIDWTVHQKLWNKQLDKLGYLDAFQEEHGHRNPKTIDVHSLKMNKKQKKIKNPTAYITKYMTKLEFGKRPVLGQLWGCSDSVKRLDYPKYAEGEQYFDHVVSVVNSKQLKQVLKEDFFSFFSGKTFDILRSTYTQLWGNVKTFYQEQNGNRKPPPKIEPKPFIRVQKPQSFKELMDEREEAKNIRKNKEALTKFKKDYLQTYDPYKANQFDIFAPL